MKKNFVLIEAVKPKTQFHSYNPEALKRSHNIPINSPKKNKFHSNKIIINNEQNNSFKNISQNNFSKENNENIINNLNNNNNILINSINNYNDDNKNQYHNGRWTEEEHQKFIDGILEYGNEWKKVQQIIKTRSSTQARSHAQKFFLRVKKIIKNKGGAFNDKEKIIEIIINNILPNKKGNTLTKTQKEKLLNAIFSNIRYEGENNEQIYDYKENGLEEKNILKYEKETNNYINKENLNLEYIKDMNTLKQNKKIIGRKRKETKSCDTRDSKIFNIQKDLSHRASMDNTFQKISDIQENKDNKINESNNQSNNLENKNNINGYIINNYINVTNNYMNNNYIHNVPNSDIPYYNFSNMTNNSNSNHTQDFYNLNYDKNDLYNNDKFQNLNPNYHFYNRSNFNSCNRINNFNDYDNNNNNQNDPFELEFGYYDKNINNNENEQQITINEEEFIKMNNNNSDENSSY